MEIRCLGSSSSGNSYSIDDGKTVLLLEAGFNGQVIVRNYLKQMERVVGCLITHEHSDHSKGMQQLHSFGISIFASKGTFEAIAPNYAKCGYGFNVIKSEQCFDVGSYRVLPFETKHDCNEPLGFLIYSLHTKEKLLFATDTYYIPYKFSDVKYILVECNYSEKILKENIIDGKVNLTLAKRLMESHFSLENVKEFFKANDISKCEEIYLLHLSSKNSNAVAFKTEIEKLTGKYVKVF